MRRTIVLCFFLASTRANPFGLFEEHAYLSITPPVTSAKLFDACDTKQLQAEEQVSGLCAYWDEHIRFLEAKLETACSAAGENIYKTVDGVDGVAFRYREGNAGMSYLHSGAGRLVDDFTSPGLQRHYRVFEHIVKGRTGETVRRTEKRVNLKKSRGHLIDTHTSDLAASTLRYLVEAAPLTSPEDQRMGFYGDRTTIIDTRTNEKLAERIVYFYVIKPGLILADGGRLETPDKHYPRLNRVYLKPCDQYQPRLFGYETRHPQSSYEFVSRVLRPKPYTDKERQALFDIALGKGDQRRASCRRETMGPLITPKKLLFSRDGSDLVLQFKGHDDRFVCSGYFWRGDSDDVSFIFYDGTRWGRKEIAAHAGAAFLDNKAVRLSLRAISEPNELQQALQHENFDLARRLIQEGADVRRPIVDDLQIVPVLAGMDGGVNRAEVHDTLRVALLHGANVNALVGGKINPILYAVTDGYADTVALLLELGADLNRGNNQVFENIVWQNPRKDTIAVLAKHGYVFDRANPEFWRFVGNLAYSITARKKTPAADIYDRFFPTNNALAMYERAPVEKQDSVRIQLQRIQSSMRSGPKSLAPSLVFPSTRQKTAQPSRKPEHVALPKRAYDTSAQLHVIGVYEGAKSKPWWTNCRSRKSEDMMACHQQHAGSSTEHRIEVHLFGNTKPVVLALMSYDPALWVVKNPSKIPIAGVILSGYHGQRIFGVAKDVPVDVFTHESSNCSPCQIGQGYFYGYERGSKKLDDALIRLKDITGKTPKSFQGKYRQKTFTVLVK